MSTGKSTLAGKLRCLQTLLQQLGANVACEAVSEAIDQLADANLAQPAQSVDVAGAIRKGFMTAESCGPDNRYVLSIKFGSLDDLQAAHNALVGLTAALQEKGNG